MPKILIVDDELDVCEFMQNYFKKRRIDTVIANNGAQAVVMFSTYKPDLMLLDVKMNGLDGLQVLEEVIRDNPNAKVIMLSGEESQDIVDKAKTLGALDFIHKPLELSELQKVVVLLLDKDNVNAAK
jgi:DNA-binding response OmpR family regulator